MSNIRAPPTSGVQASLTEETFQRNYLEGYTQIVPQDLLESKGGHVRYAVDTMRDGRVVSTQYRLGGILTTVDSRLRYIRLYNPYAMSSHASSRAGFSWSVQLFRQPNERIRLWYMPPSSRDEIVMFRKLLQQLENGDIKITKVGS
jgi:hypothetical protein